VYDRTLTTTNTATVVLKSIDSMGGMGEIMPSIGKCKQDPITKACVSSLRVVDKPYEGKDQISLRFGGDYNLFPGLFAMRAGVSYETDGQDPALLNPMRYMFGRVGFHGGVTVRVAHKTDVSIGFAHFIQKKIRLQVNDQHSTEKYPVGFRNAQYHFKPGLGVGGDGKTGFDGLASVEVPNGDAVRQDAGPDFIGAGTFYYNLDVASLTFTQHF
jgi:hypothetical protein